MLKERKVIYLFNCFGLDVNIQQNYGMKRMHLKEILFGKVNVSFRKAPEIRGKNPKNFRQEDCFRKITGIIWNRPFPVRTVRPGKIANRRKFT
jgi:hypothetical protein